MLCCVLAVSALSSVSGLEPGCLGRDGSLLVTAAEPDMSGSVPLCGSPFSRSSWLVFPFGGKLEVAVNDELVEDEVDLSETWRLIAAVFSLSRSY